MLEYNYGNETQYLNLLERTLEEGTRQKNRTGIDTFRIEGAMMEFDLTQGFPLLTTKKMAMKQIAGELVGFINGFDNAAQFREHGCTIWDQNANENQQWLANPERKGVDDLGRIYGVQWRNWQVPGANGGREDQLALAVEKIWNNPSDRRIIVSAWNPGELHEMALPPCHIMHQYLPDVNTGELSMCMYMRSCDMFLGVPFNIASYALLLSLVAKATDYMPKKLVMFLADVHIYENHLDQVMEQLGRKMEIFDPPILELPRKPLEQEPMMYLTSWREDNFHLHNYKCHGAIRAPMAV